eukprot:104975-Rhodomonas_salina.1
MSAPLTVVLPEPSPAVFRPAKLLTRALSYDPASVSVPIPNPDVTTTFKLPRPPTIVLQDTELADVHRPKLSPDMVALPCPAVTRFTTAIVEAVATSNVPTCDVVPTRRPAVTDVCNVDLAPAPTLHVTDEAESHPVPWHEVTSTLIDGLYPETQLAAPVIVIVPEPSDTVATLTNPTTALSYDPACVTLRAATPAVTTTLRLAPDPAATRHATTLSDTHPVPSHT